MDASINCASVCSLVKIIHEPDTDQVKLYVCHSACVVVIWKSKLKIECISILYTRKCSWHVIFTDLAVERATVKI